MLNPSDATRVVPKLARALTTQDDNPNMPPSPTPRTPNQTRKFAVPAGFYALALVVSLMLGKSECALAAISPDAPKADRLGTRIVTMRDAFEKRDWPQLNKAAEAISAIDAKTIAASPYSPLLPYVRYWLLSSQLNQAASNATALDSSIDAFISAHADAPFADWLRRDQLRALGKAEEWAAFVRLAPTYRGDDQDIQCHRWRATLATSTTDEPSAKRRVGTALTEAKLLWESARPASDACYTVFSKLADERRLNDAEVWLRVRRLLETGALADARRSASFASDLTKSFEASTGSISVDADRYLKTAVASNQLSSRPQIELMLFALGRVARTNGERAALWLEANGAKLSPDARNAAWSVVATAAAMQQNPNASQWFDRAISADDNGNRLSDQQLAWRVRAALRSIATLGSTSGLAGDTTATLPHWRTVKASINAMSTEERREGASRYWLIRAQLALGETEAANTARQSLAKESTFYGLLTAEELGVLPTISWDARVPQANEMEAFAARPGTARSIAFYRLGLRNEGLREWHAAVRGLTDVQLIAASEVARRADLIDRAINTSGRTVSLHDFTQRFPMPHRDLLAAQARQHQLDEAFVYGLIRQESRFISDAISRAGAIGLMQLMPATAKWAAKEVGIKNYAVTKVREVETNLALGSFYLKHVLDDLGHPVLAAAAYNAGPGRARRWRAEVPIDGVIYAESIPFNETRDYVKQVMLNKWFYLQRLGVTNVSLKSLMGTVPGKSSASARVAVADQVKLAGGLQ